MIVARIRALGIRETYAWAILAGLLSSVLASVVSVEWTEVATFP